jgi:hypothetical protein
MESDAGLYFMYQLESAPQGFTKRVKVISKLPNIKRLDILM